MENKIENQEKEINPVINEIIKLKDKFAGENGPKLYSELAKFVGWLREVKKYKVEEYAAYYAASGVKPDKPWSEFTKIDFPGDDSIEKFLKQLEIG